MFYHTTLLDNVLPKDASVAAAKISLPRGWEHIKIAHDPKKLIFSKSEISGGNAKNTPLLRIPSPFKTGIFPKSTLSCYRKVQGLGYPPPSKWPKSFWRGGVFLALPPDNTSKIRNDQSFDFFFRFASASFDFLIHLVVCVCPKMWIHNLKRNPDWFKPLHLYWSIGEIQKIELEAARTAHKSISLLWGRKKRYNAFLDISVSYKS